MKRIASLVLGVALPLAAMATVVAVPSTAQAQYRYGYRYAPPPPAYYTRYRPVYYNGYAHYYYNNSWYYRDSYGNWQTYEREPEGLVGYRTTWDGRVVPVYR
jgi:hypothetical protein